MVTGRAAGLLSLLALAAGLPAQQPDAVDQQLSASTQLSQLLEPLVERAVGRAVERAVERMLSGLQPIETELVRLQTRLADMDRDLVDLKLIALAGDRRLQWAPPAVCQPSQSGTQGAPRPGPVTEPQPEPEPESVSTPQTEPGAAPEQGRELQPTQEPEPELVCEKRPSPLPADQAPHREPAVRACARSCLQLRDQVEAPQDGVYWLTGLPVPALCDFSHDDGGWTLLLTAKSRDGWNLLSVLGRRQRSPSLDDNYSILHRADAIRNLGSGDRFAYRIETQAEKGRERWGGIWLAPRNYSFVHETPSQTEVFVVRRFDKWTYKASGIKQRMPWLDVYVRQGGNNPTVLTTTAASGNGWGTLLYDEGITGYQHSPWIHPEATHSGKVLYWMREEVM